MNQKCPSSDELLALSLGQLDEQRSDQITHHLQTCQNCQAAIAALDGDSDTFVANLRQIPAEKFGEDSPYDGEAEAKLAAERAMAAISGAERSDSDLSHVPDVIGEYKIVEVLGQGGMGQVFRGQHVKLKRPVAIKFIAKHRMWDKGTHDRFASEMQAIGGLEHPNIVTAHDAREVDGYAVLVTEFIDGMDLGELLHRKGPLPVAEACQIALEICQALEHCDSRGFVHRDIKPSNMMVSKSGEVKLLDLGLMKLQTEDEDGGFTATGQAIGTPDYVAPEQVKDSRTVDIRADLYGLGCSLYKMLTGCVPFPKPEFESAFAKMNAHLSETPIPVSDLRPDLPPSLIKLIGQLLQKNPYLRPQTPNQVKQALLSHSRNANLSQLVQAAVDLPESDFFKQQTSAQALVAAKSRNKAAPAKTDSLMVLLGVFIWNIFSRIRHSAKRLALSCWESAPARACRWIGKAILSFLTGSDIDWMIIAGLYVLLTPLLFLEADIFNILLVVSHGLFTGWKLKKEHATQTNYSAFRALMWSAFLVYGTCGLLIATQARGFIQDTLFQHPYFLAPIWEELWFPVIAVVPFVVIAITFFWAVKPAKTSIWRIALLATGWLATLVLLAFFAYDVDHFIRNSNPLAWAWVAFALVPIAVVCSIKQSERTRWRAPAFTAGWLGFTVLLFLNLGGIEGTQRRLGFLQSPQSQSPSSGDAQKKITTAQPDSSAQQYQTERQIYQLANIAGLSDYQPSDAWCEELEKTLQSPGGWYYAELFLENDPEFAPAMDHYLRKKYDLPAEVKDPTKAWATLERLGSKAVDNGEIKRVVKMVANAVDAEQLNREITKFEPVLRTGGAKLQWLSSSDGLTLKTTDQKSIQLRPLIEAAEAIHVRDDLKSEHANHDHWAKHRVNLCNEVRKGFCSQAYRSAPPLPNFGSSRTYAKSRIARTLDLLKPNPWSSSFDRDWNHYHLGVEQAPEYDRHLIRRRVWGLGAHGMPLGNTRVDFPTYKLLSRQSAGARRWRQENRELLIETALRIFADPPEEVSKDEKVLRSALASIFSSSPASGPAIGELDFLFSDPPVNNQQTLAMEFWPKLDKLLAGEYEVEFPDGTTWAKVAKGTAYEKFTIRMRYLERMWPESTPEMFVETYVKADPTVRQNFLISPYVSGLSSTIPIGGRLAILQQIQQQVDPNTPSDVRWKSDMIPIKISKTEKESIQVAISKLRCPAGAAAYLELHADDLLKYLEQRQDGEPYNGYFPLRPIQECLHAYPTKYRWRDDLFDLFAKHPNPLFRKDALNTLGNRPRPRFIRALADLQSDEDDEVRELAEEVAEQIKGYTIEAYREQYPEP